MAIDPEIVASVKNSLEQAQPLLNVDRMMKELLTWLKQLLIPPKSKQSTWEEIVKTYPAEPGEEKELSGTHLRIGLTLQTSSNRYTIAILENLTPSARGVFTAAVLVNWKAEEREMAKTVEQAYQGGFEDSPRASNILWAQTIRYGGLAEALNAGMVAIVSHELVEKRPHELQGEPIKLPSSLNPEFPVKAEFLDKDNKSPS